MKALVWGMALALASAAWSKELPLREVSVIVTPEGYYPRNLTVFQGERVKFYVTSTVDEAGCFIVQGQKVFMAASKGKVSEAEAVFEHPGSFAFYCPSNKNDGKITVLENKNGPRRGIASDESKWVPREYD